MVIAVHNQLNIAVNRWSATYKVIELKSATLRKRYFPLVVWTEYFMHVIAPFFNRLSREKFTVRLSTQEVVQNHLFMFSV